MEAELKLFFSTVFLFLNLVVAQSVPWPIPRSEWLALLNLRGSLGIKAVDWHGKANPCWNWTGIKCTNGHVTEINLSGLRRTRRGRHNPQFSVNSLLNLTSLSTFNSSGFLLNGSIPEWLGGNLSNLEVLDLSSSSISGSIPVSFGNLTRLHSLNLSNNSITGTVPHALGDLSSLSVLDLSQNLLNGTVPHALGNLSSLSVLDLSQNLITGTVPHALGNLSSLSVLDLSQNGLTGQIPFELSSLRYLSRLDLSSNYLSGGISLNFSSLFSLKFLNLSNNSLSAVIPNQLGKLSQLIELDLGSNSLFGSLPEELKGLTSLRKLSLRNNDLEGSLLNGLFQKLSLLKYLDISVNNISGDFPNLSSFNATGSIFNLSSNQFYGNLSSWIGKFHILDLSNNYFEGSAPNSTDKTVNLSNNCFSDEQEQRTSEACMKFYSDRRLHFGSGAEQFPSGSPLMENSNRIKRFPYIMIGVFGGLGFIIILIAAVVLLLKVCNGESTENQREVQNVRPVLGGTEQLPKVIIDLSHMGEAFTYEQMLLATGNFNDNFLIRHGHSGDLFRGVWEGEYQVIIKRVDLHSIRNESFMSELDFYRKVSHPKLVPLVGHCLEDEHVKILVYKYMPNGDLSNAFYRLTNSEERQSLDWITRLKIAIGAAEALSYLHHECIPPVVHRDIQASSILLDDKYEVRLGSFSEVCAPGANNHQNVIARLLHAPGTSRERPSGSQSITCAYDVYCFGKVLLELVTGKLGISRIDNEETKQWVDSNLPFINLHEKELVTKIVDKSLIIDDDLLEEVWAMAIVAKSCLNPKPSRRPSMRQVLKALENPFKVVRDDTLSSAVLRTSSSRQAWTAAFLGSWHRSSSDSSSRSGPANRTGSRGSGANDHSSSHKRTSSDVFPEPVEGQDLEREDVGS